MAILDKSKYKYVCTVLNTKTNLTSELFFTDDIEKSVFSTSVELSKNFIKQQVLKESIFDEVSDYKLLVLGRYDMKRHKLLSYDKKYGNNLLDLHLVKDFKPFGDDFLDGLDKYFSEIKEDRKKALLVSEIESRKNCVKTLVEKCFSDICNFPDDSSVISEQVINSVINSIIIDDIVGKLDLTSCLKDNNSFNIFFEKIFPLYYKN